MIATAEERPRVIKSEAQHARYTAIVLELMTQPKLSAADKADLELLGLLIETYEKERWPIRDAKPTEVLAALMEANNLRQKDLAGIFGTESMVSMVLSGQRPLALEHIKSLSRRFHVSPAAFIEA